MPREVLAAKAPELMFKVGLLQYHLPASETLDANNSPSVLANSFVATVLTLLHAYQLRSRESSMLDNACYSWRGDLLVIGLVHLNVPLQIRRKVLIP